MLTVLNKVDLLDGMNKDEVGKIAGELGLPDDYVAVSALEGWGVETLLARIESALGSGMEELHALIPYNRNDLVALWHQQGTINEERFEGQGTFLAGRVPTALTRQFAQFQVRETEGQANTTESHSRKEPQS
jgi:GTP-binding protein HflX